jgi:zinc/manganese transport system substrate-binding protein
MTKRRFLLAVLCAVLAGVAPASAQPAPKEKLPVVASFSIIGDLVRQVGGNRVSVTTIVGPDSDAHVYQTSPADGRKIAEARIIFVNGLDFEGWLQRLIDATKNHGLLVPLGNGVKARSHEEGVDPHAWQDVANAKIYVEEIRDGLARVDPDGAEIYEENARAYVDELKALDEEIVKTVNAIPQARRRVVSTHDAFGYFSARYGIVFLAPQGVSTESEPSAKDIARIIDDVRDNKVPAVFLENVSDPRLAKRIAAETGARLGGTLYSDTLSDAKGDGATYIDMMRHNVKELEKALAP